MSAKVAFLSREPKPEERESVVAVRPEAIVQRGGRSVVFRVDDRDVAHEVAVQARRRLGDLTEVAGVKPGDKVAVRPPEKLRDGMRVSIAKN
jgi:multidrug efflux pump subunit AcrA (membrane-fusion protein)